MNEITNPHDKFFKEVLSQPEAARTFLRDYLPPAVVAELDLTHLQLIKDSFVDDALQEHFADLVFEVALRNHGSAYVCILFEHKSYVDSLAALQVLRYMVHGWEYSLRQHARLWPVIPIIVYHGVARWTLPQNFQAIFSLPEALQPHVPEFRYILSDMSAYSDEELKRTAELGVGLLLLKHIFLPDLRTRLPEVLALWYTIRQQEHALGYLEAILRYATSAGQSITVEDVRSSLEGIVVEGEALVGTIAQEWLKEGRQQGLEQGIQQGIQQGIHQGIQQGIQEGIQQGEMYGMRRGLLDGIELALELRFGVEGLRLLPEILRIEDVGVLKAVHEGIRTVTRPEELRRLYQTD